MARTPDLSSVQNPRVKAVVRLREQRERRETGLFFAESVREIGRALAAGLRPVDLFFCPEQLGVTGTAELAARLPELRVGSARAADVRPTTVSASVMAKMAYRENPEGIVAVFAAPRWTLEGYACGEAAGRGERGEPELWLVAVGTQKPGNLGAMVRTADAAGAAGVLVPDAVVDAFNPNAIRASTGAVFTLPTIGGSGEAILAFLAARGVRLFAAALGAGGHAPAEADLTGPAALAIGPEDAGLDPRWIEAARDPERGGGVLTIPMHGRAVDSLNASAAAAVLLFEARRQRATRGGGEMPAG